MTRLLPLILLAACTRTTAAPTMPCGSLDAPCEVDGGQYLALPPEGWDGDGTLPAFVHFHGYNRSPKGMAQGRFTAAMSELGAFVVYPLGVNETWAHTGSPSTARDEIPFIEAVFADALERFPIDPERLLVTGFSQGGSMAWEVACKRPDLAPAFAPVSGGFWEPLPEACVQAPRRLRHVHGTADGTVPLGGRTLGGQWTQGDIREGLAVLRDASDCPAEPRTETRDDRTCQVWEGCGPSGEVELCLHDGGHRIPEGWHGRAYTWAFGE